MFINPRHDKEMPMNGLILPETRIIRPAKIVAPYYTLGTEDVAWAEGYTLDDPTYPVVYSKEADHLYIQTRRDTDNTEGTYVTDLVVDLTDIKTLYINWQFVNISNAHSLYNRASLNVSTQKDGARSVFDAQFDKGYIAGDPVNDELDVSTLTGDYYIRVHSFAHTQSRGSAIKVYKVWGEA